MTPPPLSEPKPAPVKPKPITDDPKVGQRYVTIGFRWTGGHLDNDAIRHLFRAILTPHAWIADLDVAVRTIGAGGETSEHEGTVGPPAVTEDIAPAPLSSWRGTEDVGTGDKT